MLKYFLGVEVMRNKRGIFLSTMKYELNLLPETGKLAAKPCQSPMAQSLHLTREGKLFEDPEKYRRLVGKLNYLTVTSPDIAYSVSVVSQYMSSPTIDHWAAVKQILCYLKEPQEVVFYTVIMGIIDLSVSRMQIGQDLRKTEGPQSTSGYCVFVGENPVSWKSKKQSVVSRSREESEYREMAHSACEIMWLHQLLAEVGIKTSVPTKL